MQWENLQMARELLIGEMEAAAERGGRRGKPSFEPRRCFSLYCQEQGVGKGRAFSLVKRDEREEDAPPGQHSWEIIRELQPQRFRFPGKPERELPVW